MSNTFHLKVSTPDGLLYDGDVVGFRARMIDGDVGILANHTNYVSAVGGGEAVIQEADGGERKAACIGGMFSVFNNEAHLIATTFEWADQIDLERAKRAKEQAEQRLAAAKDKQEILLAEAKLKRALIRIQVKK